MKRRTAASLLSAAFVLFSVPAPFAHASEADEDAKVIAELRRAGPN